MGLGIVATKPYIYGIARQFLSYTQSVVTGEIFESHEQALAWLKR